MFKSLSLLCGFSTLLLASCAPTTTTPATPARFVTPILAQGQQWIMTLTPQPFKDSLAPVTLTVGEPDFSEAGSVGFDLAAKFKADTYLGDAFYYDPLDSDPEFITATHILLTRLPRHTYQCTVRMPHARLNEPQTGVAGDIYSPETAQQFFTAQKNYVDTGDLTNQPTCTLTRIK